jgi:uncharacterized cupin superfamily protein
VSTPRYSRSTESWRNHQLNLSRRPDDHAAGGEEQKRKQDHGQEERFQVLRGTVGFRVGREELVAGPGQRLTVHAGTAHKFWNAGEDEAHFA